VGGRKAKGSEGIKRREGKKKENMERKNVPIRKEDRIQHYLEK
jgi:hypothetical protein